MHTNGRKKVSRESQQPTIPYIIVSMENISLSLLANSGQDCLVDSDIGKYLH